MWLSVLKLLAVGLAIVEKLIPSRTEKLATKAAKVEPLKEAVKRYEKMLTVERLPFSDAVKRMRERNKN